MSNLSRLRWQFLVVSVTLAVVAILLLSQQPVSAPVLPAAAPGGVYAEALVGSMGRLNPMLDWNNPADRDVNRLIFSGLIRFDSRGLPQPDLAESWGTSADGTLYNFSLRPNAAWHDGTPVTTADVTFTIENIRGPGSLFPDEIKQLWSEIDVRELNSQTLQMRLPEPFAPFLDYLTFGVLPKHILQSVPPEQLASSDFNLNPVGTGPYRFDHLLVDAGVITGVVLVANRDFYLPSAFIEQIVFRYYPDSATALAAYEQGEVLGVGQVATAQIPQALAEPGLSVYTSRLPQMSIVLLNLDNPAVPFLQNRNVRQALMLGLNRKAIVSRILQGQAIIADGPILPGSWAYYEALERVEYDPDAAVNLLKREGYVLPAEGGNVRAKEGEVLRLSMIHPDDPMHTDIVRSIQEDWSAIGVQLELQPLAYDQLAREYLAPRNFMAALADLNLERSPDPDPYLFWHQAEATGGQNYSQWNNRTASEYLEAARTQTDFTDRTRLYRNFQVIFARELPSLPLYYPVYSYAVDAQVRGVQVAPLYDSSDRFAFVRDWYLVTRRSLEQASGATLEP